MLVNIYNATNELDQLKTQTSLSEIGDVFGAIQNKSKRFGSDFNVMGGVGMAGWVEWSNFKKNLSNINITLHNHVKSS